MAESNCQPNFHQLPNGSPVRLVFDSDGYFMCYRCGFTFPRTEVETGTLGNHMDMPSGRVRTVKFDTPKTCLSCGFVSHYWYLPCGDEHGGLFERVAEQSVVNRG